MLNKQKQQKHPKPNHVEWTHNIDEIKINEDLRVRVTFSDPAKLQRNTKWGPSYNKLLCSLEQIMSF